MTKERSLKPSRLNAFIEALDIFDFLGCKRDRAHQEEKEKLLKLGRSHYAYIKYLEMKLNLLAFALDDAVVLGTGNNPDET